MALITISGYPASGKTRRANQLKTFLENRMNDPSYDGPKLKVTIISDDTLNIKRSVYDDGRQEKPARAALFTAVQRAIGKDTIVIVDGMNYIKGPEQCREWSKTRGEGSDSYNPATLDNLITRFEEPSSMVRWDSPLITIPWTDEQLPGEDIWKAVMEGVVKPPNAGTSAVRLTSHRCILNKSDQTRFPRDTQIPVAPSDALHTLEQIATAMISAITSEQAASQGLGTGGEIILPLSATLKPKVRLPARNITLSELQRLKRQFVTIHKKAITLGSTEKGTVDWSEEKVAEKFVVYLEENWKP
ncbi:chromatin associated protein KTI12 [Sanghuangporus baumii]|uniref:Chromatin associated protein KTI12 n=1 Tax=Sanghuangporus baumii TaxID=108892 RepID=A0A9Q5I0E2_SANBA|nr:chromatin associated protein KTI12 [Sanghuangporus baumii]